MTRIAEMLEKLRGSRNDDTSFTNYFHHDADNVGDRLCGPRQYFFPSVGRNGRLDLGKNVAGRALFGGGQIYSQLERMTKKKLLPKDNLVAWGVGIPRRGLQDESVKAVAKRFKLFGTRNFDWYQIFDFVPCVSCMHPAFDNTPTPKHDIVVFSHRRKTPGLRVPSGIPHMSNSNRPPRQVVEFLASGHTIVTSSYHGVYWAQLLGRKVICIPFNDKFRTFQHPPTFTTLDAWYRDVKNAWATDPLLEEYRNINRQFAQKVARLWNIEASSVMA